jgi:CRISPR-associated protein (Cas_Csd1).
MLAAVEGRRLPSSHLRPLLTRIIGTSPEVRTSDFPRVIPTILWALPMNEESIGYKLGELLSIADYLYYKVDEKDLQMSRRYYTMLSEQPSKVFGPMVSDVKTRLSQLQNRDTGAATGIDKQIGEILASIEEVPGRLGTEGQAQFALGYYHNRQRRFDEIEASQNGSDSGETEE